MKLIGTCFIDEFYSLSSLERFCFDLQVNSNGKLKAILDTIDDNNVINLYNLSVNCDNNRLRLYLIRVCVNYFKDSFLYFN